MNWIWEWRNSILFLWYDVVRVHFSLSVHQCVALHLSFPTSLACRSSFPLARINKALFRSHNESFALSSLPVKSVMLWCCLFILCFSFRLVALVNTQCSGMTPLFSSLTFILKKESPTKSLLERRIGSKPQNMHWLSNYHF